MGSPAGEQFGPYLVYEQLGVGGMATVHRAETTGIAGFRKPVALKRMLPHIAMNEELVRSFVREARLASHLRHSNVAQTYDLGKVGDIYFIAMELVVGRTLREILRHCVKSDLRVPIPIALNILNQVCDALDYAHNLCDDSGQPLGIIHRDVSPSNVIVSESGVVKLIDFGIAKASARGMQTLSGTIKGKFSYMAPEYLEGKIDARADLFAVGIMAHELLTNRPLFQGRDDMDTLYRVKSMPVPKPSSVNPEIPTEIDAIVMTALERDPEARWQRASAMRQALTTEIKRLGLTILDQQVVQWVESVYANEDNFDVDSIDSSPPTRVRRSRPEEIAAASDGDSVVIERVEGEDELLSTLPRDAPSGRRISRPSDLPLPPPLTTATGSPLPIPRPAMPVPVPVPSPLASPPTSGARTMPSMSPANRTLHVEAGDVLAEAAVDSQAAPQAEPRRMGNLTIFLLLLVAAAVAGAVVYFGLPYVQPYLP